MAIDKSVKLSADRLYALMSDEMKRRFAMEQHSGRKPPKDSILRRDERSATQAISEGNQTGQSIGGQLKQDAAELKSGEFSGVVTRKIESFKKVSDGFTKAYKKQQKAEAPPKEIMQMIQKSMKADADKFKGTHIDGVGTIGKKGVTFANAIFKSATFGKISGIPGMPGMGGFPGFQGGMPGSPGRGSSPLIPGFPGHSGIPGMSPLRPASEETIRKLTGSPAMPTNPIQTNINPESGKSGMLTKIGNAANAIPLGLGVAAGAYLSMVSSMAGMHQQSMQSQDSTLDVYGKYISGGGSLVSNAELAKIGISRSRIIGGDADVYNSILKKDPTQTYLHKKGEIQFLNEDGKMKWKKWEEDEQQRYIYNKDNSVTRGMKFGLSQGIGGTQGAELFAKMEKYGNFSGNKDDMKKIMSDAIHSGFSGLRQAEFFQTVSGLSENAYTSGMGIQKTSDVSNVLGGLAMTGVRDARLSSVYSGIDQGFKKSGSLMNSIAMAGHLNSGKSLLGAMAGAEEGITSKANMGFMKDLMKDLDPETRGILEKQLGISTATEANERAKTGKNIWEINEQINKKATGADSASNKVESVSGQSYRGTQNATDTAAATLDVFRDAFAQQQAIAKEFLGALKWLNGEYKSMKEKFGIKSK